MIFDRNYYLNKLIEKRNDNRIKIITGLRRVGKSTLLNELFYNYLISTKTPQNHIIRIKLDDYSNKELFNPDNLYQYVLNLIKKDDDEFFLLLDEVQEVKDFIHILLGFYHIKNLNVYVTGSNAKFLSSDIVTQFNDRGVEIRINPSSFKEYHLLKNNDLNEDYLSFIKYGELPKLIEFNNDLDKEEYLLNVYNETYLSDLKKRHHIKNISEFNELIIFLASSIGSRFSSLKLSNSFNLVNKVNISRYLINQYIDYLKDSFLIDLIIKNDLRHKKVLIQSRNVIFLI